MKYFQDIRNGKVGRIITYLDKTEWPVQEPAIADENLKREEALVKQPLLISPFFLIFRIMHLLLRGSYLYLG